MRITRNKAKALNKQLFFKKSIALLGSGEHNKIHYDHILSDEDALEGANFYCYKDKLEWESLQKWAKDDRSKVNFKSNGLKNMLRSEHIAYNIFYPLETIRVSNPELLNKFLGEILKCKVDGVDEIKVEYASDIHKGKLLNDNTSFDAFIRFQSNGDNCGAGIELKYTEGSYPYGQVEKTNLEDDSSLYWRTAIASNMFVLNTFNKNQLISKKLKQPWRNHLLGIKMVQNKIINKFYSVHLFPKQNTYQQFVAESYLDIINDRNKQYFISFTFEALVAAATKFGIENKWLSYFEERYCE